MPDAGELSAEQAWGHLALHLEWSRRFWIIFLLTDSSREASFVEERARGWLSEQGKQLLTLRRSGSDRQRDVLEQVFSDETAQVLWLDYVRHEDLDGEDADWKAAWEPLLMRLNERRERLRRRWEGVVIAGPRAGLVDVARLAPDLWTVRSELLLVRSDTSSEVIWAVETAPAEQVSVTRRPLRDAEAAREAAELYRREGDWRRLVRTLNELAWACQLDGALDEALEAVEAAVEVSQERVTAGEEAFRQSLAFSLNNQAVLFGKMGKPELSLRAVERSIEHHQRLALSPAKMDEGLATRYVNRAEALADLDRHEDAAESVREAIRLRRGLVQRGVSSAAPRLATACRLLADELIILKREAEAEAAIREAIRLYEGLIPVHPDLQEGLAGAYTTLADLLHERGDLDGALSARREELRLRRELEDGQVGDQALDLANAFASLGALLAQLGQREAAAEALQDAAGRFQALGLRDASQRALRLMASAR